MRKTHTFIIAVAAALFGLFIWWYGGNGTKISREEFDSFINRLKNDGYSKERFINTMIEIGELDDGKELYYVNLIKFKNKAEYPGGNQEYGDDPYEANRRYGEIVIPVLLKLGCHPVFISKALTSIKMGSVNPVDWDDVAIVRYRSFRDFIQFRDEVEAVDGFKHKRASVEMSEVHIVKATFIFPFVKAIVGTVLFGTAFFLCNVIPPTLLDGF